MKQKRLSDEELITAYEEHKTLGKMAHALQVPHITIYRKAQKLGLTFKNGGQNKGGSIKFDLNDILSGKHPQYNTGKLKVRLIKEQVIENKCLCCGITEWNTKPITLQLDHINGNSSDHRLENLRLLCPNCHSQTDTWCGKNI